MKLLSLYATGFKKLKFEEPLHLPEGVVLISGLNESGKSTILDAVLYALYGRVIRPPGKAKNEEIIAYDSEEAKVRLEFEVDANRFQVSRSMHRTRPTRASLDEILPDGRRKTLASKSEKVTEEVERLLGGITFNEIASSVVVAQKELSRLVEQRRDDRRKVVNVFLNLESFNVALDRLNEERKDLSGTGIRPGRLRAEEERLEDLENDLREYQRRMEESERLRKEAEDHSKVIEELEKRYVELSGLWELLDRYHQQQMGRAQMEARIEGKRNLLESQSRVADRLESQILEKAKDSEAYADIPALDPAISAAKEKSEALATAESELAGHQGRAGQIRAEIDSINRELKSRGFDPARLEKLRRAGDRLKELGLASAAALALALVLFLVGQLIPSVLGGILGAILLLIVVLKVSRVSRAAGMQVLLSRSDYLQSKRSELEKEEEMLAEAMARASSLRAELLDLCTGARRYSGILEEKEREGILAVTKSIIETYEEERRTSSDIETELNTLRRQRSEISDEELAGLESELRKLEEEFEAIELPTLPKGVVFSTDLLADTASKRVEVNGQIQGLRAKVDSCNGRIIENQNYLKEKDGIESRVETQRGTVNELRRRRKVVDWAIDAIEKTSESLRNRIRPGVERYMEMILPSLTAGRYKAVRLDEDYGLEVFDPEAGEFRRRDLVSGGTEDQLLLAMRLAFAMALLPQIKGKKPEFLFLDEPLGSSDQVRRSGILDYILTGLTGNFKQIFLISHVEGLEELIPNVIRLSDGRIS